MIKPEPVPEGLLARSLNQAFTTDEWPEWDQLDIVPEFVGAPDDFDFDFTDGVTREDSAESPIDADAVDNAQAPAGKEPSHLDLDFESSDEEFPTTHETEPHLSGEENLEGYSLSDEGDTFDF